MKNLITPKHVKDNGDETSTYECELKRNDITVKEFIGAIRRSINGDNNRAFNEWWASCDMSFCHCSYIDTDASFTLYPEYESEVEMDGAQATIESIVEKYGDCIVEQCVWCGGWGAGGYYMKIRKPSMKGITA